MASPESPLEKLRRAARLIHQITQEIGPDIKNTEAADLGQELGQLIRIVQKGLDNLKDIARHNAGVLPGRYVSRRPDGSLLYTVSVPEVTVVLRKGITVKELKSLLGSDFDLLFNHEETATPRKSFRDQVQKMDPARAAKALATVDIRTEKARVSFGDPR